MQIKVVKWLLLTGIIGFISLATAPASAQLKNGKVVQSGTLTVKKVTLSARLPVLKSNTFKNPPDPQPERDAEDDDVPLITPIDPTVRPQDIRPMNPPSKITIKSPTNLLAPQAPGDFSIFRNTSLPSAPVVSGATLNGYVPIEPSVAKNGRVVFFTTNSYDGFSGDGGQTFTYINPSDNFPADGTNDPIDGGFGGDQYAFYEPTHNLMFWLIQYRQTATTNRQRLCISRTQSATLNGGCEYFYDFTPADLQIPTPAGAGGTWLDFPDIAVSDNLLYLSSNVFCTSGCNRTTGNPAGSAASIGAVIWRISLDQLAQSSGGINFNVAYDSAHFSFRLAQGAHGTMYWAAHQSNTQLRIYRWNDTPGNPLFDDVNHAAYTPAVPCTPTNPPPNCNPASAVSPDATDFAARDDDRIAAAWIAKGVIGFMWDAKQGGNFPYPYVEVVRFNESDRSLISQGQIYNQNHAWLYPSVQPNGRSDLGGTLTYGGGTFYPSAASWIADYANNDTIVPLENLTIAQGTAGPNDGGGAYNRWGDYFSTRLNRPFLNSWVATSFVYQTGNVREPHFTWFGREGDRVPAQLQIYVQKDSTAVMQDGTAQNPYHTVTDGIFAAAPGDTVIIRGQFSYDERLTINKAITVKNENGTVVIGKP